MAMTPGTPTLGIRFDVDLVNAGSYGEACWRIFWQAIDPKQVAGATLFEGDTDASMRGDENVFCLAIQTSNSGALGAVRSILGNEPAFNAVCSPPRFVENDACTGEPLVRVANISADGTLIGDAWNARPALEAARKSTRPAEGHQVTKQFYEWTYAAVQELEQLCGSLPILARARAEEFFSSVATATGKSLKPVERPSGTVFDGLMGVVSASDRKDYTVSFATEPATPGFGVFTLETFDSVIGVFFCAIRVSERSFLTYAFMNAEKNTLKQLLAGAPVQPPQPPKRKGWWARLSGGG